MKCYYHQQKDAVGICASCGKGLCVNCAADLGHGLACKDRCEEALESRRQLVRRAKAAYRSADKARMLLSVLLLLAGLGLIGWGIYERSIYVWIPGLCLLSLGVVSICVKNPS